MTNKPKTGDFLPPVFLSSLQETTPGRTIGRRRIFWDLRGKDRIFFPIAQPHTYRPSFLQCHTNPTPNCHTKLILNCHAELVSASRIFPPSCYVGLVSHCHAELVSASLLLVNTNLHNTISLHTPNCHAELVSASRIFFHLLVTPDSYLTVMLNSFQHLFLSMPTYTTLSPYTHKIVMLNLFQHLVFFHLLVTPDSYLIVMLNSFRHLMHFAN